MNSVQYNVVWKPHEVKPLIQVDKMYTYFFQHLEEGYSFQGETHDFWEALYVIGGKLRITADNRIFMLSSGGIVFHKPLELHKLSVESKGGADILIFSFSTSGALADAMENKTLMLSQFCRRAVEEMCDTMQRACKNTPAERENFICAHELFRGKPEFLQMTAMQICNLIISLAGEESRYTAENSQSAILFSKAVEYMGAHISDGITVLDIARHVNISESGVKRIFKRYTNMGVHKYFLLLKIQNATKLLKDGHSVAQTAEALGFGSQGYFSACYKRETGRNPSEIKE